MKYRAAMSVVAVTVVTFTIYAGDARELPMKYCVKCREIVRAASDVDMINVTFETQTHIFIGTETKTANECGEIAKPSTSGAEDQAFINAEQFCTQTFRLPARRVSPFQYFESPCLDVGGGYHITAEKHFSAVAAYECRN